MTEANTLWVLKPGQRKTRALFRGYFGRRRRKYKTKPENPATWGGGGKTSLLPFSPSGWTLGRSKGKAGGESVTRVRLSRRPLPRSPPNGAGRPRGTVQARRVQGGLRVYTHPGLGGARGVSAALRLRAGRPRRGRDPGAPGPASPAAASELRGQPRLPSPRAELPQPHSGGPLRRPPDPEPVGQEPPKPAPRQQHAGAEVHPKPRQALGETAPPGPAPRLPAPFPLPPEVAGGRSLRSTRWWRGRPAGSQGALGCGVDAR